MRRAAWWAKPGRDVDRSPVKETISRKGVDMGDLTQRLKGKVNQVTGRTKSKVGYESGHPRTELKGDTQQLKGEAQEAVGKARSKVKKAAS